LCHWRLHHRAINALASPSDAFELVVLGKSKFPQGLKDTGFRPFQKAGVDCAGTAKALCRKSLPLAAGAQNKNDTFKYQPGIFGLASSAALSDACAAARWRTGINGSTRFQNSSVTSHAFAFVIASSHTHVAHGKALLFIYG
jgi:hypothetical protein